MAIKQVCGGKCLSCGQRDTLVFHPDGHHVQRIIAHPCPSPPPGPPTPPNPFPIAVGYAIAADDYPRSPDQGEM